MLAILDDVGHLENAEQVDFGAHDRRGQRHIERAELDLLQHFLVATELARAIGDDLRLAGELGVGALSELICALLKKGAWLADVTELDFELRARWHGGQQRCREADCSDSKQAQRCACAIVIGALVRGHD